MQGRLERHCKKYGMEPVTTAHECNAALRQTLWASLKTPQIENTMESTFLYHEFAIQKCTSEPHCI